jgi:hypothetical protein
MQLCKAAALSENPSGSDQHLNWDGDFPFIETKKFKTYTCVCKMFAQQKLKPIFSYTKFFCIGSQIRSCQCTFKTSLLWMPNRYLKKW